MVQLVVGQAKKLFGVDLILLKFIQNLDKPKRAPSEAVNVKSLKLRMKKRS